MTDIGNVTGAIGNALNQGSKSAGQSQSGGASFGDILKGSVEGAIEAQHKSEEMSAKAIMGQADMTDVLQAVTNAEMTLNTVLAIRDRVVQAYQEVMRTPI